ncbi:MAG: hypothetical protein Solivirus1_78 [Solivirus sp.]|uniref:Ankyrin repeat protein n=1 Tax=Solivirus sp. TaxID=2487772 RepID=A0A3G5AHZ2_9VIRU|nr:MAG: hypothetical protein Solivirus1_78 [Solivirus sp.]
MTWKEFYNRITPLFNGNINFTNLIRNGKLIELKILYRMDQFNHTPYLAKLASTYNQLEILKWLAQLSEPIVPTQEDANMLAYNGNLEILKWMATLTPPILPDEQGAFSARRNHHKDVVEWLETFGIYSN